MPASTNQITATSSLQKQTDKPVDIHIHIVGNGNSGSGCQLSTARWQKPLVTLMTRHIGLTTDPEDPGFDSAYTGKLLRWVKDSSLSKAVILACDHVYDEDGKVRLDESRLYVPNDYVLRLAAEHNEFLPGVSIHPARSDALAELDRCAIAGAVLLKLLPCVQAVDIGRTKYRPFWKRMAELGIPLLAHTGGELSLPTVRPDLRSPACLRPAVECGVTVVAAHCGAPALPWHSDYFSSFDQMRLTFPNFYGDLSALSQPAHLSTLERLRENPTQLLYGSDYPVVTAVIWSYLKGWINWEKRLQLSRIVNPLELKLQLTRALGFPERIFSDAWNLLARPETPRLTC